MNTMYSIVVTESIPQGRGFFHASRINRMMLFCTLFIGRLSQIFKWTTSSH